MAIGSQTVVLAAGLGTRMRSRRPKVLHELGGIPLIDHVLAAASGVSAEMPLVVVNRAHPEVASSLAGRARVIEQSDEPGTGGALRSVPTELRSEGPVVVLSGDVPLLRAATLEQLIAGHLESRPEATIVTVLGGSDHRFDGLGRVLRSASGGVREIVEERDLTPEHGDPPERNAGIYIFDGGALWPALERLHPENAQSEYYLTDVIAQLERVEAVLLEDPEEALGINDRRQLAEAERILRRRTLDALLLAGVTILDPATTYIDPGVEIGEDAVIHPMTVIRGRTRIGTGAEIGPGAQLVDVVAGDGVCVGASVLERCELGDGVTVGHFNRVRPDSRLGRGVSLGTHAEVKNSTVGEASHISHFSCVLDSDVGARVNIGAGTVTCNFDGTAKHRTTIGDDVFVGTNSTLVAPLRIESDSYIGAGSFVSQDVPSGALAVGRARQRNIEGWVERRRRGARE